MPSWSKTTVFKVLLLYEKHQNLLVNSVIEAVISTVFLFTGCKMNNINVVYTPWGNLKKTADMDVGQIGFHRQKEV